MQHEANTRTNRLDNEIKEREVESTTRGTSLKGSERQTRNQRG